MSGSFSGVPSGDLTSNHAQRQCLPAADQAEEQEQRWGWDLVCGAAASLLVENGHGLQPTSATRG